MNTKEDVLKLIAELELPPIVKTIFEKGDLPVEVKYSFGCPEEFFIMTEEELAPWDPARICPLFDDGNFGKIYAYHREKKKFLSFYTDDPGPIEEVPCMSWDSLFVPTVLSWWEDEIEDDRIIELGNEFGLKHVEHLLATIDDDSDDWQEEQIARIEKLEN